MTDLTETGVFRLVYCVTLAVIVGCRHRDQLQYLRLARVVERPARILDRLPLPRLSDAQFNSAGGMLVGLLALGAFGPYSGVCLMAAVPVYFLYFGQILSLSYVARKTNLIPQILLVLAVSSLMRDPGGETSWALTLTKAILVQVYLSAASTKLRGGLRRWLSGEQLQGALLFHDAHYNIPLARRLAELRWLCACLTVATLVHQLTFWIVLIQPAVAPGYVSAAMAFHVSTLVLMRIDYLTYQGPAYLVFCVGPLRDALQHATSAL
jgi:hypothetical protein